MTVTERQRRYAMRWDALILHCPGPERESANPVAQEWAEACEAFLADDELAGRGTDCDDLTIVTYNTRAEPCLLERCLAHLGVRNLAVLGKGLSGWRWSDKIELVYDYLESGAVTSEYVLCLDGDDVLVLDDPALVFQRFLQLDCEMLFCATRGDWPPSPECAAFEDSVAPEADPAHRHLNAGGYLARTSYLGPRLKEVMAAMAGHADWCTAEHGFDDQLAWRQLHRRYYPQMRVDTSCRVFLRFDDDR